MSNELSDRALVVASLRKLMAFPVENSARVGTPDVAFVGGWIELKRLSAWPKRPETVVRIPHYTAEQRAFSRLWAGAGGQSYLLLRVGHKEWLLWNGVVAATSLGHQTRDQLLKGAIGHWVAGLNGPELLGTLIQHMQS
jgi:hypothetical protein